MGLLWYTNIFCLFICKFGKFYTQFVQDVNVATSSSSFFGKTINTNFIILCFSKDQFEQVFGW